MPHMGSHALFKTSNLLDKVKLKKNMWGHGVTRWQ